MRIGVYLVDVLDEAHGYTFIADTYSGSDGNQPGVIDVKIRIVGINVMFLLLHLITVSYTHLTLPTTERV